MTRGFFFAAGDKGNPPRMPTNRAPRACAQHRRRSTAAARAAAARAAAARAAAAPPLPSLLDFKGIL